MRRSLLSQLLVIAALAVCPGHSFSCIQLVMLKLGVVVLVQCRIALVQSSARSLNWGVTTAVHCMSKCLRSCSSGPTPSLAWRFMGSYKWSYKSPNNGL